ncbi:MAG: hypothetical protein AAFX57_16215 [Bacteroidota bacterium]
MFTYTSILQEKPDMNSVNALAQSVVHSQHMSMVPTSELKKEDVEIFDTAVSTANDGKFILVSVWKSKTGVY